MNEFNSRPFYQQFDFPTQFQLSCHFELTHKLVHFKLWSRVLEHDTRTSIAIIGVCPASAWPDFCHAKPHSTTALTSTEADRNGSWRRAFVHQNKKNKTKIKIMCSAEKVANKKDLCRQCSPPPPILPVDRNVAWHFQVSHATFPCFLPPYIHHKDKKRRDAISFVSAIT